MPDIQARIHSLYTHPVKSCGGIATRESPLTDTGLDWDRQWMVVDAQGEFLSQRELPRMALIRPQLRGADMLLRAPGMLALHVQLDVVETACRVRVWEDEVRAYDMGALAAQWFSDFLGRPARLVRFDPEHQRLSSRRWTGTIEAANAFSDGFPLLLASTASLEDLNRRLRAAGQSEVGMERFRPNIVIEGAEPYEEDALAELLIHTEQGPVRLKPVKPCARCSIPDVNPEDASTGHAVFDALAAYRANARLGGALAFGMNCVILEGVGHTLRTGQLVEARIAF